MSPPSANTPAAMLYSLTSSSSSSSSSSASSSDGEGSIVNAAAGNIEVNSPTLQSPKQQLQPQVKTDQQADLRKKIMAIQTNAALSPSEKARRVQSLMSSNWTTKQQANRQSALPSNKISEKLSDFSQLSESDLEPTFFSKELGIFGCKHYKRAAKLQGHCCGKWFACRFCHDEVSDHTIVRNLTTTMMCMYCTTVQAAGRTCINVTCQKVLSKYYCSDCKLWDDDGHKNIYHCHDCGICRIGKGLGVDYFHCKKCNVCMAMSLQGRHKCIERNLESDCPICGEYMFTSTTTVIFMPCGHCIHQGCYLEYTQASYQCPTCSKSLANMTDYFRRIDAMLASHSMPPEYQNTKTNIYCNDCEKKSVAKYHFLYHKCKSCNGYNSKVLSTFEQVDGEEEKEPPAIVSNLTSSILLANATGASSSSMATIADTTTNTSTENAAVSENEADDKIEIIAEDGGLHPSSFGGTSSRSGGGSSSYQNQTPALSSSIASTLSSSSGSAFPHHLHSHRRRQSNSSMRMLTDSNDFTANTYSSDAVLEQEVEDLPPSFITRTSSMILVDEEEEEEEEEEEDEDEDSLSGYSSHSNYSEDLF